MPTQMAGGGEPTDSIPLFIDMGNNNNCGSGGSSTSVPSVNWGVYTIATISATNAYAQVNYTTYLSSTSLTSSSFAYIGIGTYRATSPPFVLYWTRTRETPPAGVQPTVTFGAVQASSSPITSVSIGSPSNSIVDAGQWETFNALVVSGTAPFTYNFFIANSITFSIFHAYKMLAYNGITFQVSSSNDIGQMDANVFAYDATPSSANSIYSSGFNVYPALNAPTIPTISNTLIDAGQFSTFTPSCSGGAPNYVENVIISNQITKIPVNSIRVVTASCTPQTLYFGSSLIGNTLQANVVIIDSATTNAIANSIYYALGFNALPSINTLTISNAIVDVGQTETFNAIITGGTANYAGNALVTKTGLVTNTITVAGQAGLVLSESWVIGANEIGTETANYIMKDSASTPIQFNSVGSGSITVSSALLAPTITSVSNTLVDGNQFITITPAWTTGSPNYIENVIISNQITDVPINSITVLVASATAETFYLPSWMVGNSLQVNVIVKDSATVNEIKASAYTAIGFSSVLSVAAPSPNTQLVDAGQYAGSISIGVPTTGTPPYTYQWYWSVPGSSSLTATEGNTLCGLGTGFGEAQSRSCDPIQNGGTATVGIYNAIIIVKDSATTNAIVNSIQTNVIVNTALGAISVLPAGVYGIDAGQAITFNAYLQGGISGSLPYEYSHSVVNSITSSQLQLTQYTNVVTTFNNIAFTTNANLIGNTIQDQVTLYDCNGGEANCAGGISTANSGNFLVNYDLITPTITVVNSVVYAGQSYETFAAYEPAGDGTGPFTYNFIVYNSFTNHQIGNYLVSTNTYTFAVPSYWTSNTPFYGNVFVTDNSYLPVTVNSIMSATANVLAYTALIVPTIASNTIGNVIAANTLTLFAYEPVTNGAPPFTYSFSLLNANTLTPVVSNTVTSNSAFFNIPLSYIGDVLVGNVAVRDTIPLSANSITTANILIISGTALPPILAFNPSNSFTSGQNAQVTATGQPATDSISLYINGVLQSIQSSGSIVLPLSGYASGVYNVNAIDTSSGLWTYIPLIISSSGVGGGDNPPPTTTATPINVQLPTLDGQFAIACPIISASSLGGIFECQISYLPSVQPFGLWIAIVAVLICVFIINQVSRSRKNEHRKRINHI